MITSLDDYRKRLFRISYYDFFKAFWGEVVMEPFVDNWHIKLLCDELQAVGQRVIDRQPKEYDLVINVSPGESKSTICTVLFPVWLWTIDPSLRIITGSFSGSLSIKHSTLSRDCIRSLKFQKFFGESFQVRKDIDQKTFYKTDKGGERIAVSVGSGITGQHAHLIIVDDPMDPQGAASDVMLEKAKSWITTTLSSRKVDKAITPTILIMQRLHQKDPTGVLLERGGVRHISLPAEIGFPIIPESLAANYVNGLMNPTRTNRQSLAEAKKVMGEMAYAGQYGQQPTDPGGGKVKRHWWQKCRLEEVPADVTWDMWIDGAYTASTANDPTGIMIAGYSKSSNALFVRHCVADHLEMPELLKLVPQIADQFGLNTKSRVYIEPKASGKSLRQMLRVQPISSHLSVIEIKNHLVQEGKEARIQTSAPKVESGSVYAIDHPSTEVVIYQNAEFPKADHDEFVDLLGYACYHYFPKKKASTSTSVFSA